MNAESFDFTKRNLVNLFFFGSDRFSLLHLQALKVRESEQNDVRIRHVITASDETPVALFCTKNGLGYTTWPRHSSPNLEDPPQVIIRKINEFQNPPHPKSPMKQSPKIITHGLPLVGVVVSFGRFLPASLVASFALGCFNLHPSLLPRWSGSSPIFHTLLIGDKVTGITAFRILPEIQTFDAGPILYQKPVPIPSDRYQTPDQLTDYVAPFSVEAMFEILQSPNLGKLYGLSQTEVAQRTGLSFVKAPRPTQQMTLISWDQKTANDIVRCWYAFAGTRFQLTTLLPLPTTLLKAKIRLVQRPFVVHTEFGLCSDEISDSECPELLPYLYEASQRLEQLRSYSYPPGSLLYIRSQKTRSHRLIPLAFVACKPAQPSESNSWLALSRFVVDWPNSGRSRSLNALDFHNGFLTNHESLRDHMHEHSFQGVRLFGQFESDPNTNPPIEPWTNLDIPSIQPTDFLPDHDYPGENKENCSFENVNQ